MSENIKNSAAGELSLNDFRLDGELQSDGAKLCRIGVNHFKLTLSGAPGHDDWANWIRLEIARNARGKRLRLEVEFPNSTNIFFFTNYAPCWSYDGGEWTYVQWTPGFTPGRFGVLEFPEFAEDRVLISAQMPMTLSDAARLTDTWARQPCVSIHLLGRSLGGRDLRRITVTDPGGPHPPARRWVHHVANQHPGEGVAQWYIAGMVNWLLSDEAAEHRKRSIWHFTLMMNPDGVAHGWCRVNKQGVDMNRSYRVRGADESAQCHEAYIFQRDFEELMRSESPVTASWSMHAWPRPNQLEPIIVGAGPEMRKDALGHWGALAEIIERNDPEELIYPLAKYPEPTLPTYWDGGPHHQFGITTVLIEGGGGYLNKRQSLKAGAVMIKSALEYYRGLRPVIGG